MSPLGNALPSPCCGADWQVVNPGVASSTHLVGVIGCLGCGTSYSLRADVRVHGAHAFTPVEPTRRRLNSDVVDDLAARAAELVEDGHTVLHACLTVGIDRHSFYNRHPTKRRTA